MKKNIYFCESFNQIPIALYLNEEIDNLLVYTRHESFKNILTDFSVQCKLYDIVDFNSINSPVLFLKKYILFYFQLLNFSIENKSSTIYTSSATGNVGLFVLYFIFRKILRRNVYFVWWNTVENINGKNINFVDIKDKSHFYIKKYIRLFFYKFFIFYGTKLKNFNGEIFFCVDNKFFNKLLVSDKRLIFQDIFYKKYSTSNLLITNKIIFICGGYNIEQEFAYFNREKVIALFKILSKYREHVIFKIHPSGHDMNYFLGSNFDFNIFNEVKPIEGIASSNNLLLCFGSSSLQNLADFGYSIYCLNNINGYGFGLINNEFTDYYAKFKKNIYFINNFLEVESLINEFIGLNRE